MLQESMSRETSSTQRMSAPMSTLKLFERLRDSTGMDLPMLRKLLDVICFDAAAIIRKVSGSKESVICYALFVLASMMVMTLLMMMIIITTIMMMMIKRDNLIVICEKLFIIARQS